MINAYDFFPHGDSRHYWYTQCIECIEYFVYSISMYGILCFPTILLRSKLYGVPDVVKQIVQRTAQGEIGFFFFILIINGKGEIVWLKNQMRCDELKIP